MSGVHDTIDSGVLTMRHLQLSCMVARAWNPDMQDSDMHSGVSRDESPTEFQTGEKQ